MTEHEFIKVERSGHVFTVTLDRPGTRNACSMSMWLAIRAIFREIAATDARAVILTGAGGDFCSGADVVSGSDSEVFQGSQLAAMRLIGDSVTAVHDCPIPVIVKVDGVCVGAGFGMALAGDVLYCSDRSRFSLIFAKRGLSLDYGSSWLIAKRIGIHKAKEIALTAEMMDAERAAEVGFLNRVIPADELDKSVDQIVEQIASGPPLALSMTKKMLDGAANASLAQALEQEATAQTVNLGTKDMIEAFKAFREKRTPEFKGR